MSVLPCSHYTLAKACTMEDDDIYEAPSSNDIDFFKIKNRFEQQTKEKPDVRPKPQLRESYIQKRIQKLHSQEQTNSIKGRDQIVSTFPPNNDLPPKQSGNRSKLSNSPFLSPTTSANNTPPPLTPKNGPAKKVVSPFIKAVEPKQPSEQPLLPAKASSVKKDENLKPKEGLKRVTINEKDEEKKKSVVRKSLKAEKENILPDGLTVGMIRRGTDGKSYKLLVLPPNSGSPPPKPPMPENVDLSPYFQDDDMYDDVDVSLIGKSESLKRGSMRPFSEILPMTEEEEEEMERKLQAKRRQKPDSEIYDDTMQAEDDETYDDIANVQQPQEIYEAID